MCDQIVLCTSIYLCYVVLNNFFQELDKRVTTQLQNAKKRNVPERREREIGATISNCPPPAAPSWTIDKDWLKGNPS